MTFNAVSGIDCSVVANNNFVVRNNAHGNGGGLNYNFAAGTFNAAIYGAVQNFVVNDPWGNFQY